jgi:hypothetical protein
MNELSQTEQIVREEGETWINAGGNGNIYIISIKIKCIFL